MKRRGIFGGTFDPPHIGHIMLAQIAYETLHLDLVEFVPAGEPPHKEASQISPASFRVALVEAAIATFPYFHVSLREIEREGLSYTVDTIKALHKEFPQDQLFFFVGGDMLHDLPNWRDPDEILRLAHLVIAPRPNVDCEKGMETLLSLYPHAKMTLLEMPKLDIASRWIKERLRNHQYVEPLLMPKVSSLIAQKGWYQS